MLRSAKLLSSRFVTGLPVCLKFQCLTEHCNEIKPRISQLMQRSYCQSSFDSDRKPNEGTSDAPARLFLPSETLLMLKTVGEVFNESVQRWPNKECIVSVHQNVRLTFSDVLKRVDRLAAGFKKIGVKKGDRVILWGPNDVEWFLGFLASARIGAITVNVNPAYQQSELNYSIEKTGAKVIVSPHTFKTQDYARMALEAKKVCPTLEHIIIYSDDHITGTRRYSDVESLASRKEVESIATDQGAIRYYDPCNIQFTSGTTGKPKATVLLHSPIINNFLTSTVRLELGPEDRICLNVPFFHIFAMAKAMIACMLSGCTIVLEGRSFNPVKSLEIATKEKCNVLYGTPTMWVNLIDAQQRMRLPMKIDKGTIGGATTPVELYRRIKQTFHFEKIQTIYGLTETLLTFQSLPGEDSELNETTVGCLYENIEAMVVDENGNPVSFGTPGELWVRSYANMHEYWGDEESTRKIITEEGWLKTGDQFILHSNGYGHVIGRYKDMIIRGGENIFPKEIEDFLVTHPQIVETQVIGAHDDVYGEEICACVRLQEGAKLTKDDIRRYCKGKIAYFKIPRYIEFVDEYPKTTSGKIQKFKIKEDLEARGIIPRKPT